MSSERPRPVPATTLPQSTSFNKGHRAGLTPGPFSLTRKETEKMKTYVIWLSGKRKEVISASCFTEVMAIVTLTYDEADIKRIYCADDDCSLVMYRNVSSPKV